MSSVLLYFVNTLMIFVNFDIHKFEAICNDCAYMTHVYLLNEWQIVKQISNPVLNVTWHWFLLFLLFKCIAPQITFSRLLITTWQKQFIYVFNSHKNITINHWFIYFNQKTIINQSQRYIDKHEWLSWTTVYWLFKYHK